MNLENIIVIGVCLAAITIATYYFYNKYNSQKQEIVSLSKRCETIEMILTKPPPPNELSDVYNRTRERDIQWMTPQNQNGRQSSMLRSSPATEPAGGQGGSGVDSTSRASFGVYALSTNWDLREGPGPSSSNIHPILIPQKCSVEGLCDLRPLQIETSEAEINEIVDDEINVIEKKIMELSEARPKSPPKKMN